VGIERVEAPPHLDPRFELFQYLFLCHEALFSESC
jgi:hypothetical protein